MLRQKGNIGEGWSRRPLELKDGTHWQGDLWGN